MNLVVDIGNSSSKTGLFEDGTLVQKNSFQTTDDLQHFLHNNLVQHSIISSVKTDSAVVSSWCNVEGKRLLFDASMRLPIQNRYATPGTLGADRLAAACGAWATFPHEPCLVIDMGTCINYEYINPAGEYLGGAISPGIRLRFDTMHRLTANLPIVSPTETVSLIGDNTIHCLQSGVMNGTLEEIKGMVARYRINTPGLRVILCGGDAHFFENHLKPSIFVAPDLVLMGLNSILLHNVNP
jgi:type III pantothenate kinase